MNLNLDTHDKKANANTKPIFSRHETFHPRYGWLKKAYDAVAKDPYIFSKDDAALILGLGKNMVKALRYWAVAFKLIEEEGVNDSRQKSYKVTDFANNLLRDDGWDPYLEDPASLWLLHWELLKPIPSCDATAWWYAFNAFHKVSFTQEEILQGLCRYSEEHYPEEKTTEMSLKKDIHCILRMYYGGSAKAMQKETEIISPFVELDLILDEGDSKHFTFNVGEKGHLPSEIIVATCLDYIRNIGHNSSTISMTRLLYEENSPGLVLKIPESVLCNAVEQYSLVDKNIFIEESAGLLLFGIMGDVDKLHSKVLNKYYQK
jgi:hypothetical protein